MVKTRDFDKLELLSISESKLDWVFGQQEAEPALDSKGTGGIFVVTCQPPSAEVKEEIVEEGGAIEAHGLFNRGIIALLTSVDDPVRGSSSTKIVRVCRNVN